MREKHCSSKTGAQRSQEQSNNVHIDPHEDQRRRRFVSSALPCEECLDEGLASEIVDVGT